MFQRTEQDSAALWAMKNEVESEGGGGSEGLPEEETRLSARKVTLVPVLP